MMEEFHNRMMLALDLFLLAVQPGNIIRMIKKLRFVNHGRGALTRRVESFQFMAEVLSAKVFAKVP